MSQSTTPFLGDQLLLSGECVGKITEPNLQLLADLPARNL